MVNAGHVPAIYWFYSNVCLLCQEYINAGATINDDLSEAPVIVGVKQVPIDSLLPEKTYVFFSHTIKAQEENMELLDAILEKVARILEGSCDGQIGI